MKKPLNVADLFPEIEQIGSETLRAQVAAVWEELWQASEWDQIDRLPTSPEIPYPHVPHNRAVVAMALAVADAYERFHNVRVDRDVLIAAGLLQDASKLVEMRPAPDGKAAWSEMGRRYPHGFWAAHIALRHGVPDAIGHIILTHTPLAPRFPESLEGKILYYVDQLDVLAFHRDRWRKDLYVTR